MKERTVLISWSSEDIAGAAIDRNIDLTEKEINSVMDNMENSHDCTIGINWDVINVHIDSVIEERGDSV
jgi:hypothetical protein